MKSDLYFVYMTTNDERHTALYIGVTNNLIKRIWQHKHKVLPGFTKQYNVDKLVYYEVYQDPVVAIAREKQIKRWSRIKKEKLINGKNPTWDDLSTNL